MVKLSNLNFFTVLREGPVLVERLGVRSMHNTFAFQILACIPVLSPTFYLHQ